MARLLIWPSDGAQSRAPEPLRLVRSRGRAISPRIMSNEKRPYIGGQAVIEGVMMRSPKSFAIVVRRKSGELVVRERPIDADDPAGAKSKPSSWPLLRGVFSLVE